MSLPHVLFVYGTLKRGFCRAHFLSRQMFLGVAQTLPKYRMFNCGTYPGIRETSQAGLSILGELWAVDEACLARLDQEEGVSEGLYSRRTIEMASPLPSEIPAPDIEAYFYLPSDSGFPDCGDRWV